MATLSYTELKPGVMFVKDGEPYSVLSFEFSKKHRQAGVVRARIKNLISGKVLDFTAQPCDEFEKADLGVEPVIFIYSSKGEFWFCYVSDKSKRFSLNEEALGGAVQFLKEGLEVKAFVFNDGVVNIELPVKVDYVVNEAPPAVRGNTAQGGTKVVVLETGAKVNTPLFVGEGDTIRVNTTTGEYVERVGKA